MTGDYGGNTGNSILYRRWDGISWSAPLDILFVPGESRAEWPVVAIDAENRLHLVWQSFTAVYYASAPSWQADSAHHWTEPLALTANADFTPWGADITADAQGVLHVVYAAAGDEEGLNYIRSTDGGESWGLPLRLYGPLAPSEEPPSMVQIVADAAGRLHVVWQTNQVTGGGYGVYYARSTDGGDAWSAPVQLATREPEDFSTSTPYLMANGESELHLIYVDGSYTGSKGRFHCISRDGGATWGVPKHIITELVGMNSRVMPVVDGAGQMHLIANMRTESTQVVGIYYARWQEAGWSPVVAVEVSVPQIHYTAATVRLGNELHITYTGLEGAEVWHIRGIVSGLDPQPALAPPAPLLPTQPVQAAETAFSPATPEPEPVASTSPAEMLPSQATPAGIHPLLPAVVAALAVVVGVIAWTRIRPR
ncbi:MAG: exo-alpha-sialidase [Anaerolineae bacterium]|nr:exo-alpha-sialidase [Anaerolineae bacterium]